MSVFSATNSGLDKKSPNHFNQYVSQGSQEGALIATVAVCAFLFLSLISYSSADPAWTNTGLNKVPVNYGGLAGAWCADILLYFFGYVAYLFPTLVGLKALSLFARKRQTKTRFHWPMFWLRLAGLVMLFVGATGLLGFYSVAGFDDSSGGIFGMLIATASQQYFNLIGSTLLLVSLLLAGFTIFTGMSWISLMDRTGGMTLKLCGLLYLGANFVWHFAYLRYNKRREKRALRRASRIERAKEKGTEPAKAKIQVNREPAQVIAKQAKPSWIDVFGAKVSAMKARAKQSLDTQTAGMNYSRCEPEVSADLIDDGFDAQAGELVARREAPTKNFKPAPSPVPQAPRTVETEAVEETSPIKISPFVKKSKKKGKRAQQEQQGSLFFTSGSSLPSFTLLDQADKKKQAGFSKEALEHLSRMLEEKLLDFGVSVEVVEVNPGPVITRFEIKPAAGVKVSKISNLAKDLARSLAVMSVRVVEVIPGKSVVGIEIPNENREIVRFSEVVQSKDYDDAESPVTLGLGNDIAGDPIVVNLAKMPHLLVAGTTGSGKSVGVNSMILSILFKSTPEEVRFIMVDPKMLELSIYDGIPHLLTPVVTDMKEAANSLRWCVAEMERRYKLMASMGVRNVAGFNKKVKEAEERGEPLTDPLWQPDEHFLNEEQERPELATLPFIVVVIDEFADMMMIVGKKVEELIARIAQKARAAGIHLILATQRPSVDVITGLIKANVPTRISFQVSSKIDSRTVLDQGGAEQLLGHGDMLYMPPGTSVPIRVHGAFVDDHEVHKVVDDWKQRGEPEYIEEILTGGESSDPIAAQFAEDGGANEQDALFDHAVAFVTETRKVSISSVQRKLKIGYNRSANLVEAMEAAGVVSSAGHNGTREVLAPPPPRD